MSEQEKTIDKIRKLMNLGNKSMYKGEAENAMAAAMRLAPNPSQHQRLFQ